MTGSIEITGTTVGAANAGTSWTGDASLIVPEPWMQGASCASSSPDAWFPELGEPTADAKRVCKSCDVVEQCLAYALEKDERFGIWGGKSPRERAAMKRGAA